jgi:hypothetical protein
MTSLLTKQSLRETAASPDVELVAPPNDESPLIANLDEPMAATKVSKTVLFRRNIVTRVDRVRFVTRAVKRTDKLLALSKPMFEPTIIQIPPADPPVTFSAPHPRAYVAKVEYRPQPMSPKVPSRDHDSLVAKIVKKPWQFMKAFASKFR